MFKKKKGRVKAKKFISYNGYVKELDLIKNGDGRWLRPYVLEMGSYDPDLVRALFPVSGYRMQILADRERVMVLIGVKADLPEEADRMLLKYNNLEQLKPLPVETWFDYMGLRLTGEDFPGFPDSKKEKRIKAIDRVMPYDVSTKQTEMEISGKTVRTLLFMGYPTKVFPAFATELLSVPGDITLSLHVTAVDPELCLDGLKYAEDVRPARKDAMRSFLERTVAQGGHLYQVAFLITVSGEGDETLRAFKRVSDICKKYLTGYSELNFQQKSGFVSTLPLLQNQINYNVVLSSDSLIGLCPWSKLQDRKTGVSYGADSATGEVLYDRFRNGEAESALIVSSDPLCSVEIMKREIRELTRTGKSVCVLMESQGAGRTLIEDAQKSSTPAGTTRELQMQNAPSDLYKKMVIHWARNCAMTNGHLSKTRNDLIREAAEIEASADFLEKFLERIEEPGLKSALRVRPFPKAIPVEHIVYPDNMDVYLVNGTETEKALAYAYLLQEQHGIIYAVNMELVSTDEGALFTPHEDSIYAYSTSNLSRFYRTRSTADLLKHVPFYFIGEHQISHKLALISVLGECGMYLSRDEKNWISEPAKGSVLITPLVSYMLSDTGK